MENNKTVKMGMNEFFAELRLGNTTQQVDLLVECEDCGKEKFVSVEVDFNEVATNNGFDSLEEFLVSVEEDACAIDLDINAFSDMYVKDKHIDESDIIQLLVDKHAMYYVKDGGIECLVCDECWNPIFLFF